MAQITPELNERIEALYAAFAQVPKPERVDGCTNCCIGQDELDGLLAVPIRELSPDALAAYASNAFCTVGDEADFRYLLPRLFELAAQDTWGFPDGDWVIRNLKRYDWLSWPAPEHEAVHAFLDAWWQRELQVAEQEQWHMPDDTIASLMTVDPDHARYLDAWLASTPGALANLARFITWNLKHWLQEHEWSSWAPQDSAARLLTWLGSGPPFAVLAQAMESEADFERQLWISDAWVLVGKLSD